MSKSMTELFNPLTFKLVLDAERPYFEVDGARTYLLTEDGAISQNAVEILLQLKVEKKKYEDNFETVRKYLVAAMDGGAEVQKGNRDVKLDERTTVSNQHKAVLEALAQKVFQGDQDKIAMVMEQATTKKKKSAIKVDGTFV